MVSIIITIIICVTAYNIFDRFMTSIDKSNKEECKRPHGQRW
jgi:hypothetical protein